MRKVGWLNRKNCGMKGIPASAYPATICWKPHQVLEEDELSDLNNLLLSPIPPDDPPVPHRRTISEVTARPEREQEDDEEHPAQRQTISQEGGEQAQGGEQEPRERPTQAIGQQKPGKCLPRLLASRMERRSPEKDLPGLITGVEQSRNDLMMRSSLF